MKYTTTPSSLLASVVAAIVSSKCSGDALLFVNNFAYCRVCEKGDQHQSYRILHRRRPFLHFFGYDSHYIASSCEQSKAHHASIRLFDNEKATRLQKSKIC
jgi:hypothetical protein